MFRKIFEKFASANLNAAAKGGRLRCPKCNAKPQAVPSDWNQTITCGKCGTTASPTEWSGSFNSGILEANADEPPQGTKIGREVATSGTTQWKIPASGKSGGLMFFAILWCTITGAVSSAFLFGMLTEKELDDAASDRWWLVLFFALFWAIGIGMFYGALRNKFARHRISIDQSSLTLHRELFGKTTDKSLPLESIKSIAQAEFYQKNYEPVFGIEIRGNRGKLRFGSILSSEEKAWLVADIKRAVFGEPQNSPPQPAHSINSAGPGSSYFSIVVPQSSKHLWALAIMLMLMGIGFVVVGIIFLGNSGFGSSPKNEPLIFKLIGKFFGVVDHTFRFIWLSMSTAMAGGGIYLTYRLMCGQGKESRIEGNSSEIAIRTYKHTLMIKERVFPRESVTDIRSSVSGSSNGRSMKRVELIVGNKAEKVASWIEGEKADVLLGEVRHAMGFTS
jgi:hypothetical protein